MIPLQHFSDLLEALYSAPLDQEQWQRFLTLLCNYTKSKTGVFFCADTHRGITIRALGGSRQDIDIVTVYNERYGNSDPFRAALIRNARIGVFQGDDILPNEGLLQTDMYREFVSRLGIRYATLMPLTLSVRRFDAISVWRTEEIGPMDEDCNCLLSLLLPHIQKALEIHRALGVMQQQMACAEVMADASPSATFLLTRQGRVVHSNGAAAALVSDGNALTLRDEMLVATHGPSRKALQTLLLKASLPASASSNDGPTRAMPLSRTNDQRPLQLLATRLSSTHRAASGADILVLVTDPERTVRFPDDVLQGLYALTPAEVEVANGILMGYSLHEIADLRRVSRGTIRNQLKTIMSKTRTDRQSDLVRLLMALPQSSPD
jgi:DNA-binding CsgD family transcriptional regulator/PAS domain-containing protein